MDNALNPQTADYTRQSCADLRNAVYVRLATPLGSWWANTKIGSKLHELKHEKDLPRVGKIAVDYARQALSPLLADGRALTIDISWARAEKGFLLLYINLTAANAQVINLAHNVAVG
jgi:phage gp46-like protein